MRTGKDITTQQDVVIFLNTHDFGSVKMPQMSQTPQAPGLVVVELISGSNSNTTSSPPSTVTPGHSAPSAPNQPTDTAAQPLSEGAATQVSPTKATCQVSFCMFSLSFLFSFSAIWLHGTFSRGSRPSVLFLPRPVF